MASATTLDHQMIHQMVVDSCTSTGSNACTSADRNVIATSPRLYLKGIHLPDALDSHPDKKTGTGAGTGAGSGASTCMGSTSSTSTSTSTSSRKVLFQRAVKELFSVHGQVVAVFVRDVFADYAFVAMATTEQAQRVLNHTGTPHTLFEEIHPAADLPPTPTNDHDQPLLTMSLPLKLTKMESHHLQSIKTLREISHSANLLVQCNKSHMERVHEVLSHQPGLTICGTNNYKIVSLIFCHCTAPEEIMQWLDSIWYIQPIIQRIFLARPSSMSHHHIDVPLPILCQCMDVPDASAFVTALKALENRTNHRIRLGTYPPILQSQLAPILKNTPIPWNPQSPTHILNVVQLVPPTWQQEGLYWIGLGDYIPVTEKKSNHLSPTTTTTTITTTPSLVDSCSRAYFKLQEALERYFGTSKADRPPWPSAIDVGASPGGWTQFLLEQCHSNHVYCIDPGKIDSRVWESCQHQHHHHHHKQPSIDHIAMKYQEGLPEVAKRRTDSHAKCQPVNVYVSDMCVKTMSEQIDALLLAVDLGLVQPSTTFVILTIKCTRGHSKATFDTLVNNQVDRIQCHIHQLQILHLFANRYSERTIMGYWN